MALCLLLSLTTGACSAFDPGEPPMPDSVLAEVMVDLQLLEARAQLGYPVTQALRDSTLHRHGVDQHHVDAALAYYAQHPKRFAEAYGAAVQRLNDEHWELTGAPEPTEVESLRAIEPGEGPLQLIPRGRRAASAVAGEE